MTRIKYDRGDLYARAVAAYYRTAAIPVPPVPARSGVEEHDGRHYVVLRGEHGVADYRVRRNGRLMRDAARLAALQGTADA